jgi:hypothetical protein
LLRQECVGDATLAADSGLWQASKKAIVVIDVEIDRPKYLSFGRLITFLKVDVLSPAKSAEYVEHELLVSSS